MTAEFPDYDAALAGLAQHEEDTNSRYATYKVTKDFGKCSFDNARKVQWIDSRIALCHQNFSGVPFMSLGLRKYDCQFGRNRKKKRTLKKDKEGEMTVETKPKTRVTSTKKTDCPAMVAIREICRFPEFQVTGIGDEIKQKANVREILDRIDQGKHIVVEHIFVAHFPTPEEHTCHAERDIKAAAARCLLKGTQVLKKKASLKGKNLMELALQFKTTDQMPFPLARPKGDQRLQDMNDQELLALYHQITGEVPNNMFSIANREFNSNNLRLLIHLCIVSANAAAEEFKREQTHRSVRIKGTEENFIPEECLDMDCPVLEPHMHCPLCTNLDSYIDQHLLKNHFAIGHVKKAIEFSGLKMLRCLDDCEIVGRKGRKDLQKGHWHCYKCSNGFDKRADALEHYNYHLKSATSNFQIKVNPNLYQVLSSHKVSHEINTGTCNWETHRAVSNVTTATSPSKTVGTSSPLKRSYGAAGLDELETIDHTAVFIQEDGLGDLTETYTAEKIPIASENDTYVITVTESAELTQARTRIRELELKCNELEKENAVQKSHIEILQQRDIECTEQVKESKKEREDLTAEVKKLKTENEKLKEAENLRLTEKRTAFEFKDNSIRAGVLDRNRLKSVVQGQKAIEESLERVNTPNNSRKTKVITIRQMADGTLQTIHPIDEQNNGENSASGGNVTLQSTEMLSPAKMQVKQSSLAKGDSNRGHTSERVTLKTVAETSAVKVIQLSAISDGEQTNVVSDKSSAKMGKVNKVGRNSSKSVTPTSDSISSQPSVTTDTNDQSCAEGKPPPKKVLVVRASDDDKTDATSKVKSSSIRSIRVTSLKPAKKNKEKIKDTVTTELVPTASEPSLMEDMCNQLSSMRKEIDLLKQQATSTNSSSEEKE